MTLKTIGRFDSESIIWGGGRFKIPEVKGFFQLSGVQFKIVELAWITPTDDTDIQTVVEQALKTVIEAFTYYDEVLIESVVVGDVKPKGLSTAIINLDEPGNNYDTSVRGRKNTTATGSVTFAFKEELSDAKVRRKKAAAFFVDYLLTNPSFKADI